jgi:hypothetical protein
MEKLPLLDLANLPTSLPDSMPSLPKPPAERLPMAAKIVEKIIESYPYTEKVEEGYLSAMTEFIAGLSNEEIEAIMDPREGVVANCEFLPKIADLRKISGKAHALKVMQEEQARAQEAAARAFQQTIRPHTSWKKIEDPEIEVPPLERRKQVVAEVLGYDPQDARSRRRAEPPAFATVKIEDLKSSDDLKTPPRPISPEMRRFLIEQGWPHVPPEPGQ